MIYLDHAATTPIFPEALHAMQEWYRPENVGNPSSIHSQGVKAKRAVEHAREQVAAMIHAKPKEIFFTSGGTESNNAWMRSFMNPEYEYCFASDALEHKSIWDSVKNLSRCDGIDIIRCAARPCASGVITASAAKAALAVCSDYSSRRILAASFMLVNNELGTINPVSQFPKEYQVGKRLEDVTLHTDAVQAAGHIPIDVSDLDVDFLSMSAHKFGGPIGVGILYIRDGTYVIPDEMPDYAWLYGGGQERGFRSGTENVPGIVGTGVAAEMVSEHLLSWMVQWKIQRQVFLDTLNRLMPGEFHCNGSSGEEQADNIISLTIPGVHSEALLLMLDAEGICISAGSACSSGELSHVLKGIGMSDEDAACTIRVSLGVPTTEEELLIAAKAIARASAKIKKLNAE